MRTSEEGLAGSFRWFGLFRLFSYFGQDKKYEPDYPDSGTAPPFRLQTRLADRLTTCTARSDCRLLRPEAESQNLAPWHS